MEANNNLPRVGEVVEVSISEGELEKMLVFNSGEQTISFIKVNGNRLAIIEWTFGHNYIRREGNIVLIPSSTCGYMEIYSDKSGFSNEKEQYDLRKNKLKSVGLI